ncbi:MAG: hypothetical protein SAK29_37605 [Scytonema sp. PMC 1069.18]|nr:hypothetical protein [Scytonema sp. PMC 1069.18]MEC4881118.1 hypothetical protein [Scytonema sp. PMC 1070.18]
MFSENKEQIIEIEEPLTLMVKKTKHSDRPCRIFHNLQREWLGFS